MNLRNKKKGRIFFIYALCLFVFSCEQSSKKGTPECLIATSIAPLSQILQDIFGSHIQVIHLLEPTQIEEDIDFSLHKMQQMVQAQYYFSLGLPIDALIKEKNLFAKGHFIALDELIQRQQFRFSAIFPQRINKISEKQDNEMDPHIWMSPHNMKIFTKTVVDKMVSLFPVYKDEFEKNYQQFDKRLTGVIQEIKKVIQERKLTQFLIFHPSLGYFAKDFHLKQYAIEQEGKEITLQEIEKIMQLIQQKQIKGIFLQTEYPLSVVKQFTDNHQLKIFRINTTNINYFDELETLKKSLQVL